MNKLNSIAEAKAYGYAIGVLNTTETDPKAEIEISIVKERSDNKVDILFKYYAGQELDEVDEIEEGIKVRHAGEMIAISAQHTIDLELIETTVEAEKLVQFLESLTFDPDFTGEY